MIDIQKYLSHLNEIGIQFVTGVPDTLLNDLVLAFEASWPKNLHVIAANEGNAIALAAGYHLATKSVPLIYMQNSGLGNSVNPLISLADREVYGIPMVLVIGWRGEPGSNDWPQHKRQGELTLELLALMNIPSIVISSVDDAFEATNRAVSKAVEIQGPVALVAKKGVFARSEKAGFEENQKFQLSREDAIAIALDACKKDSVFIATTGRASRELYALRDLRAEPHSRDFLNVGAMGHALSIATGISLARPSANVVCLDGDGAVIMHMGSLAIVGSMLPRNLLHIVLNNGAHESVGGQATAGQNIEFCKVAKALGYKNCFNVGDDVDSIRQVIAQCQNSEGPSFIEIRIKRGMRENMPKLVFDLTESKLDMINNLSI